jgi:hypothetical protein
MCVQRHAWVCGAIAEYGAGCGYKDKLRIYSSRMCVPPFACCVSSLAAPRSEAVMAVCMLICDGSLRLCFLLLFA